MYFLFIKNSKDGIITCGGCQRETEENKMGSGILLTFKRKRMILEIQLLFMKETICYLEESDDEYYFDETTRIALCGVRVEIEEKLFIDGINRKMELSLVSLGNEKD